MPWWWGSSGETISARRAEPADRARLSALLAETWRRQGPLAAEEQVTLLGNRLSMLAFQGARPVGFLGVSPRLPAGDPPERWADLTMVAVAADRPVNRVLSALRDASMPVLRGLGFTGLACLAGEGWLRDGLAAAGLVTVDRVLGYARSFGRGQVTTAGAAQLRIASASDADTVLAINAAAFEPFWRYDDAAILTWLLTSDHAVLAETAGQPVGFALTAQNSDSEFAYLIRIGIQPAFRGRGIGRQLVADAIAYAQTSSATGLALNTQATNAVSRRLYESLGFSLTGQTLAVMVLPTGA